MQRRHAEAKSMRDIDIRLALRRFLHAVFATDPTTVYLEELALCQGDARVDLAVVNGQLHGYEIKSDRDTLNRLPRQRDVYGKCFDTMTIVVGSKHREKAESDVPSWWGIIEASDGPAGIELVRLREPEENHAVDATSIVQLLWRSEALAILCELGCDDGVRSKPRREIWRRLVEQVPYDELRRLVREKVKTREGWRSGQSPFRCGDSRRSSARSLRSRKNLDWLLSQKSRHPQN